MIVGKGGGGGDGFWSRMMERVSRRRRARSRKRFRAVVARPILDQVGVRGWVVVWERSG